LKFDIQTMYILDPVDVNTTSPLYILDLVDDKPLSSLYVPDPVDGSWSAWMAWSTCTASCNGGYHKRSRSCNSPQPSLGGQLCDGMPTQTEICNTHGCQGEITKSKEIQDFKELFIT
jgi:hypothetical protein